MVIPLNQWREQLQRARDQDKTRLRRGQKGRAQTRLNNQLRVENIALAAVVRFLPKLLSETASSLQVDTNWFHGQWSLLVAKLPSVYRSHTEVKDGLRVILERLHAGNAQGCWSLPLISIPLTLQRSPLPYNENWFKKASQCVQAQQNWYRELAQRPGRHSSELQLLVDILHSAVFHSGVHHVDILHAFIVAVSKKHRLCATSKQVWLPLTIESKRLPTNVYSPDGVAMTECKVFLSLPTLGLIYRWYRREQVIQSVIVPERRDVFDNWIRQWLAKPITSLHQLCQGGALVCSMQSGVKWPQILSHVASGQLSSTALPHQHWLSLHHPAIADDSSTQTASSMPQRIALSVDPGRRQYHGATKAYSPLLTQLRAIIAEKQSINKKNTSRACIDGLTRLLADNSYSKSEHILIDWLLHLAKSSNNKPSTLRSYLSRGGQQWLNLCYGQDLSMWEGEQFLTAYRSLIETSKGSAVCHITPEEDVTDVVGSLSAAMSIPPKNKSLNNASYIAERLGSLHKFASIKYQLAPLPEDIMSRERQRPHVRANYISEVAFNQFILSLERRTVAANSRLGVIYTVAFRAGLRLSEILKLRLKDLERSAELWMYIRDTRLDDGKTESATRKIPLGVLLTEQERQRVDSYLEPLWGRMKKHPDALVFASDDGNLIPLPADEVTGPLTEGLEQLTGQRYTFHHLRHSALSRLQLVLHYQVLGLHKLPGWQHFMPWNEEHCARIYQTITNSSTTQSAYWALAQLAGHQTPETTLNNYLHFSDWVSAAYLRQAEYDWPEVLRREFTGMSQARLSAEGWFTEPLSWTRCSGVLLQATKRWSQLVSWDVQSLQPLPVAPKHKLDFNATLTLLRMIAGREDLGPMLARYQITQAEVDELVHKARLLRGYRTQMKHTRLVRSQYPWQVLAPGSLRSYAESSELNAVVDKARAVYQQQKSELLGWVTYILRNANTRNADLPFTVPDELTAFLKITLQLIPASSVAITVIGATSRSDKAVWQQAIGNNNIQITRQQGDSKKGRVLLRIRHPDEDGIRRRSAARSPGSKQFERYSTPLLRTVAFVLALKLMTLDEIREVGKSEH